MRFSFGGLLIGLILAGCDMRDAIRSPAGADANVDVGPPSREDAEAAPDLFRPDQRPALDVARPSPWQRVRAPVSGLSLWMIWRAYGGLWVAGKGKGTYSTVLRFDGTKWADGSPSGSGASQEMSARDVAVLADGSVWTAGSKTSVVAPLWRFDGKAWSTFQAPGLPSFGTFTGIAAIDAKDVWLIGYTTIGVLRYHNGVFSQLIPDKALSYVAVEVTSKGAWVAGNVTGIASRQARLYHHDGKQWSLVLTVPTTVRALRVLSANDIWILGYDVAMHFDGTSVTTRRLSMRGWAFWVRSTNEFWVAGENGTIRRYYRGRWFTERIGSESLSGIWGDEVAGTLWCVGYGTILRRPLP